MAVKLENDLFRTGSTTGAKHRAKNARHGELVMQPSSCAVGKYNDPLRVVPELQATSQHCFVLKPLLYNDKWEAPQDKAERAAVCSSLLNHDTEARSVDGCNVT